MIRIGVTGTVAAGKSTVGQLFEDWGAARVDADELARVAVAPGSVGLRRVVEALGESALGDNGEMDRPAVRSLVFHDAEARARLERIVHAEIARLRADWRERCVDDGARILVEEVPLLFETGMEDQYDAIVVVDAPVATRRRRAMATRGWTDEEFDAVEASQLEPAVKRSRADFVIWNDGDTDGLATSARTVWDELAARSDTESIDGPEGRA